MAAAITLGRISIEPIVEQTLPFVDFRTFFPALAPELLEANRSWLQPRFLDPASGKVIIRVQSYLVRTPDHTILVDTCVGNDKARPARPMWNMLQSAAYHERLAAAGVTVSDIDFVMCTHLHVDHVGWNTRLDNGRWVPTFPNARYLFTDRELDYWTKRAAADPASAPWMADSVLPIVEANRADFVRSTHTFTDDIRLVPTPGHTIDHYSVEVGKPGADALITGDMVHSPIQMKYPELGMMSDYDSTQSGETRRRIFSRCCDASTLLCTAHFPTPSAVRLARDGDGFRCIEV